ncbi:MAG: competence/damage-inducible protein A [Sterolibacteriaceae bacterium]|uniref:Competence/damage-inducible protein A n=1 Tax=Candidatus Methylophosphatis roskildensis TaxID=2899263 RepID=A0A9D7E2B1_9PROT|nr:competence/damage-inducible protein A [Candidatus Methylophosphatis roskildensis]
MGIGAYIIGDEILSGRRPDKHFARLIDLLAARGLQLAWVSYIGDERPRLIGALRRSFAADDIVLCFGGIGATPDDHTRQAAAAALGVQLELHPEAEREIRARFADDPKCTGEMLQRRLRLGEFPAGARIIPNPFNRIPGFSVREHWFMPGFPEMAWPMIEWVLDTHYRELQHARETARESVVLYETGEGDLLDLMQAIAEKYTDATLSCLPSFGGKGVRRHIELGMSGDPREVREAMEEIRTELSRRGIEWQPFGR